MAPAPLSPEQADAKRDFERLFGDDGWHRLEKEWKHRVDAIRVQALDTITNENNLWYQRGIVAMLEELLRLRDETLSSFDPPKEFESGDSISGY